MPQRQPQPGVVISRPDLTLLDTREMPWEDHHYPGVKCKVLSRDPEGWPSVQLLWIPGGVTSFSDRPERHAHRILERGFVLAGELTQLEYESLDDKVGKSVVFKPGYYMDRQPGSYHGADPLAPSPVGFLYLEWRSGPHYLGEKGAVNDMEYLD